MKRKKEKPVMNAHGPIRVFDEEMLFQTEQLAMLGASNKQLSIFFEVHEKTIAYWIRHRPEFAEARKRGGMVADMSVAKAMLRRATGYEHKEEKIFRVGRKLVRKKVTVHVPADVKAMMFWLSNRQRDQWTAATSKVEHKGTVLHEHKKVEDLNIEELTEDTQKMLFEVAQKQLLDADRSN